MRERSELNRRVVSVALSALGKKLDSQFSQRRLSHGPTLLARLKPGEQQALVALMQRLLLNPRGGIQPLRKRKEMNPIILVSGSLKFPIP